MITGDSVKGRDCLFCPRRSSRTGEHAFPRSLTTRLFPDAIDLPPDEAGYSLTVNGVVQLDRHGSPRLYRDIPRDKTPCCESHNRTLYDRFEAKGQDLAIRLFGGVWQDGRPVDDLQATEEVLCEAADRELLGLWLLKTLLLLNHPATIRTSGAPNNSGWFEPDDALYSWMVDGTAPPPGLWLWCSASRAVSANDDLPITVTRSIDERAGLRFRIVYLPRRGTAGAPHPSSPFQDQQPTVQMWPPSGQALRLRDLLVTTDCWPTLA